MAYLLLTFWAKSGILGVVDFNTLKLTKVLLDAFRHLRRKTHRAAVRDSGSLSPTINSFGCQQKLITTDLEAVFFGVWTK